MIAEILSTGDEVLLGDIIDTNSGFLCGQLREMGIPVRQITAVGDTEREIADVLNEIGKRSDICLVTGGLGPTQDDVTALAAALAAGETLVENTQALDSMVLYFNQRGFEITPANKKQAMLPASAGVLVNGQGTAPGFYLQLEKCCFFFMPGVPSEMRAMFEAQVKPRIAQTFGLNRRLLVERLRVFGLPESRVGSLLQGFETRFPEMRLGFRASFPTIEVKMVMPQEGEFSEHAQTQILEAREWVVSRLENKVVSLTGQSLQQVVGDLLREQQQTLAIAESCTGGLISTLVTDVAGSSDYFLFSAVTYSNAAKVNILKVDPQTLETHGAVHEQTALEMARGARQEGRADWALSTTGIAGPGGGTPEKPVGTVCIAVAGPGQEQVKRYAFNFGSRERNKQMFAAIALERLRRSLVASQ